MIFEMFETVKDPPSNTPMKFVIDLNEIFEQSMSFLIW